MPTSHKCNVCSKTFSGKSILTRHLKLHGNEKPAFECEDCGKLFQSKNNLDRHSKQHLYPKIPLDKPDEARLKRSTEADQLHKNQQKTNKNIDKVWLDVKSAEAKGRKLGGELWRACLTLTWGQYSGQSFKWLLENDVGWVVWTLAEFSVNGEQNKLLAWQKERLLELAKEFPLVMCHVEKRIAGPKVGFFVFFLKRLI